MSKQAPANIPSNKSQTKKDTYVSIFGQPNEYGDKFKAADEEADAVANIKAEQAKDDEWKDQVEELEEERDRLELEINLQEEVQRRKRELIGDGGPKEEEKLQKEFAKRHQTIMSLESGLEKLERKIEELYENRGRESG